MAHLNDAAYHQAIADVLAGRFTMGREAQNPFAQTYAQAYGAHRPVHAGCPCHQCRPSETKQALDRFEAIMHDQTQRLVRLEQKVDLLTSMIAARLPAATFIGRDQSTTTSSASVGAAGDGGLHDVEDDAPNATASENLFCHMCAERAQRRAPVSSSASLFPPTFGANTSAGIGPGCGASVPLSPSIAATDDFDRLSVSSQSDTVGSSDTDGEVLDLTDSAKSTCGRGDPQSEEVPQSTPKPEEVVSWLESVE